MEITLIDRNLSVKYINIQGIGLSKVCVKSDVRKIKVVSIETVDTDWITKRYRSDLSNKKIKYQNDSISSCFYTIAPKLPQYQ